MSGWAGLQGISAQPPRLTVQEAPLLGKPLGRHTLPLQVLTVLGAEAEAAQPGQPLTLLRLIPST